MTENQPLHPVLVTRKEIIARDVYLFELRYPLGAALPPFDAGSHIALQVPSGAMRQYSLCNDPFETDRYAIAVKREAEGRGGSLSLTEQVTVGDTILAAFSSNMFQLDRKAKNFILVAGGIGITPTIAIMHNLMADGLRGFKLYYFSRDVAGTAFMEELSNVPLAKHTKIVHN